MADGKPASGTPDSGRGNVPEQVAAIPLIEERLSISKRQVESGRVRVHVTVEERQETVTQELQHDELQIERIPKNQRLTEVPRVRLEGNTTIVPVVKEVVVVEKALMLVEEIHICRRPTAEVTEIPVILRAERATVEREPAVQPAKAAE
jgi:uncharacterized protein (TIGR02271 family)